MWNKQRLKRNARVLLKANYLKVVVVGLILSFLIGSGYNSARGAAKSNDVDIDVTDLFSGNLAFIVAMLIGIAGVIAIALLFNVVLNIFLWNPLEVGCRKVFVDCRYGNAEWCDILYAFKNGYGHIGAVMFMKDLFTFLWTLLFIIPGIIKGYEYMMIPYLLAENPDMSRQDAFAESKRMMDGNKMDAFLLDLSFIGWFILGAITFNIVNILYTTPYMELAHAELYHTLRIRITNRIRKTVVLQESRTAVFFLHGKLRPIQEQDSFYCSDIFIMSGYKSVSYLKKCIII